MQNTGVGIRSICIYVPDEVRDSEWISRASGIPESVIREKFGIKKVHKAREEMVSDMAVKAAEKALSGLDPMQIDLVVYCGSEYKDYYLYNCAAAVQHRIGAENAAAFELHSLCSAGVYSLKVVKSMMLQDPDINNVLLVSASKEGDLINYTDQDSRFMFNFGDGAAAVLLQKDLPYNQVLETKMLSNGAFAQDVCVPAVGNVNFAHLRDSKYEDFLLQVTNINNMKEQLDPITLPNFIRVIEEAVKKSGFENKDINFIAPLFMKKSISVMILDHFGLKPENTFLLEEYGHCQSADVFISLKEGERLGRVKPGDLVVLVAAGTGYTWAATALRWGS
mgnify:CR=1 FL=1